MENENNEQVVEETKFMSEGDDSVIKVDLSKPRTEDEKPEEQTEETPTSETDDSGVAGGDESTPAAEKQEEVQPEAEAQESPVLEEITDEEVEEQAELYNEISYKDVVSSKLKVMDLTAITLCEENEMPIRVFDGTKEKNIYKALTGEKLGTLIK